MNSTRELVACRLDEADSCLRENTAVDVESSNTSGVGAVGSAIVLYNPLDEGKTFEIVVAGVVLLRVVMGISWKNSVDNDSMNLYSPILVWKTHLWTWH